MEIQPLRLEAISPIQYYYSASDKGMRTSSFIGDIALKYSFLHQIGELSYNRYDKFQPDYAELNNYNFWFTVGINETLSKNGENSTVYMKNMLRNTMQGIDYNGTNVDPTFKTGSLMYKNFFFVQMLKPGNIFYTYLISEEKMEIPKALRIGNNKTGILKVSKDSFNPEMLCVLNLFTVNNIMKRKLPSYRFTYREHIVLQYALAGFLKPSEVAQIYGFH
ncbi:MAG: type I-D CRISPR-associated protein Cas5/Csc1 [Thermoplasmataceae archaeon]